jgi:hypothetical protein
MHSGASRRHSERGVITMEMVFLVPLVILPLIIFAVYCGRVGLMSLKVERAAREAARSASQQLEKEGARSAASQSILDQLGPEQAANCSDITNATDPEGVAEQPEGFLDQGLVIVTLECTLDISLFKPFITSSKSFTSTAFEPVDEYRSRANATP